VPAPAGDTARLIHADYGRIVCGFVDLKLPADRRNIKTSTQPTAAALTSAAITPDTGEFRDGAECARKSRARAPLQDQG